MGQNAIDFLRETAAYMVKDRPDVYTHAEAVADLSVMMDRMRESGEPTWTSFTSYMLILHYEDDVEEWFFVRKISGMARFPDEEIVMVYGHHDDVNLLGPEEQDEYGEPLTDDL